MRKLLYLLPLMSGAVQANTPMTSTTAVFKVPAGAKTVVIEMDGNTHVESLLGAPATFPLRIVMTPSGVRYAYSMKSGSNSSESTASTQVNLKYTPFTKKQLNYSPALNTWTTIATGTAQERWKITFGNGQGLKKESNQISVNVLFTQKNAVDVKDSLRPPQAP